MRPKVMVGVPNGGTVKEKMYLTSLSMLMNADCELVLMGYNGAYPFHGRWNIGQRALQLACSHILYLDNDMALDVTALGKLLAHNVDLVGAAYNYRALPIRTTVKMKDAAGKIYVPESLPNELFQCAAVGLGCTLVTTAAMRKIPQPWFGVSWREDGSMKWSDDVWFCHQAASVGIPTWCDPTLTDTRHIGEYEY